MKTITKNTLTSDFKMWDITKALCVEQSPSRPVVCRYITGHFQEQTKSLFVQWTLTRSIAHLLPIANFALYKYIIIIIINQRWRSLTGPFRFWSTEWWDANAFIQTLHKTVFVAPSIPQIPSSGLPVPQFQKCVCSLVLAFHRQFSRGVLQHSAKWIDSCLLTCVANPWPHWMTHINRNDTVQCKYGKDSLVDVGPYDEYLITIAT